MVRRQFTRGEKQDSKVPPDLGRGPLPKGTKCSSVGCVFTVCFSAVCSLKEAVSRKASRILLSVELGPQLNIQLALGLGLNNGLKNPLTIGLYDPATHMPDLRGLYSGVGAGSLQFEFS